jgi:hypothetical protein
VIDGRRDNTFPVLVLITLVLLAAPAFVACGKKGPPLPPLRLVPAPVSEVTARRSGNEVQLQFVLPTTNQNGPGRVELGRVEVYAVTIAPGAAAPANADLLIKRYLVGTIPVRPAPREDQEAPAPDPGDQRPGPGEKVTFVEELTPEKLQPVAPGPAPPRRPAASATPAAPAPVKPGAADPGAVTPGEQRADKDTATAPASLDPHPTRIYTIRGVTPGGRPGAPGARLAVSLSPTPLPPTAVAARFTERAIAVSWIPPVAEPGGAVPSFNIYRADAGGAPLNPSPITTTEFEHTEVTLDHEQCFTVRTVVSVGGVALESPNSEPGCVTPRDIFAPAAPAGLQVVAAPDAVELSWDANTEPDLAGYVVLRGEAPGDTLQPLMTTPTRETTWRDTTVRSGVRYVYAVIALDTATPPNASPQSARQEVTAR